MPNRLRDVEVGQEYPSCRDDDGNRKNSLTHAKGNRSKSDIISVQLLRQMVKWVDEKILQLYFKENCDYYSLFLDGEDKKISQARFNGPFDRFPDIYCVIDDEEYPVEVEWLSSNYDHFDHSDHSKFEEQGGFLVVFRKDGNVGNFQQIEVDKEHFMDWFDREAERLVEESVEEYEREAIKERQYPKVWAIYVPKNSRENFEVGSNKGIRGFEHRRFRRSGDVIRQIQEKDIVLFHRPVEGGQQGYTPRMDYDDYYERAEENTSLRFHQVSAFKVTEDYSDERGEPNYDVVWPDETIEDETYPHRFSFDETPILSFTDVPLHTISKPALRPLRYTMNHSLQELEYQHFLEVISNFTGGTSIQTQLDIP